MFRRRGAPLVRAAATTAVVAGTAGAVRHHQDQKYARQDYEQQQMYAQQNASQQQAYQQGLADAQAQQQQYAPPPPPPPPAAAPSNDLTSQLQQLSQLHNAGVLSDEEFAAAKQKLLNA